MTTKIQNERVQRVDLDLDALRKGNAGGRRTKTFRLAGETYVVAAKMPMYVALLMGEERIIDAMRLWLGDEQHEMFMRSGLDDEDFQRLIEGLYGDTVGESEASAD